MKFRTLALNVIFIGASTSIVYAQEPITGGFGLNFGQIFNTEDSDYPALRSGKDFAYVFEPSQPYEKFDTYFAVVTPITHIVYGIGAVGKTEFSDCKPDMDVLVSILSEKYGQLSDDSSYSIDPKKQLQKGRKLISVKCNMGFDEATLEIQYKDDSIAKLAEEERIELESKKVNKDGL